MVGSDLRHPLLWAIVARPDALHHDVPAPDEVRLKPAVGWLLAGLPQMQASIWDSLAKPVTLTLSGPGGGTWILDPRGARRLRRPAARLRPDRGAYRQPGLHQPPLQDARRAAHHRHLNAT